MALKRVAEEKKKSHTLFLPVKVAYCGVADGRWDGAGRIAGFNTILE